MTRKEKKPVHHVQMTEGKRAIIQQLLQEYDIETAEDIQDALKDLLGGTIKEMMEAEMDDHLGYSKSERIDRSEQDDYRNGTKQKQVNSGYGPATIDVPQDRNSTFEPQVVKKRQKDISGIDQKIISMYAKGMTTRQIFDTLMDIYGFEASEGFISDVTDKLMPQIEEWQNRPLDEIYPVLYIDAIHYSVRDNGVIHKLAAYVIMGISLEGKKGSPDDRSRPKRECEILAFCPERPKEPGSTGYHDHLRRRAQRDQGGDPDGLPADRIPTLHRTPSQEHPEVCIRQRPKTLCC